jgi:DnaK suppressor protein
MTKAKKESYRRRLLGLKKRHGGILTDLEEKALRPSGSGADGALADMPSHAGELSAEEYAEELSLGLLENESRLLAEINDALRRLEQGIFGRCEECAQTISQRRLCALPYARYCLRCARRFQNQAQK